MEGGEEEQDIYSMLNISPEDMQLEGGEDDARAQTYEEMNQLLAAVAEAEAKRQSELAGPPPSGSEESEAPAPLEDAAPDPNLLGGVRVARRKKKADGG